MPYVTESPVEKLVLSNSNYWIEVKLEPSWGDVEPILLAGADRASASIMAVVAAWNVDGPNGPLPIVKESLAYLKPQDALLLMQKADEIVERVTAAISPNA